MEPHWCVLGLCAVCQRNCTAVRGGPCLYKYYVVGTVPFRSSFSSSPAIFANELDTPLLTISKITHIEPSHTHQAIIATNMTSTGLRQAIDSKCRIHWSATGDVKFVRITFDNKSSVAFEDLNGGVVVIGVSPLSAFFADIPPPASNGDDDLATSRAASHSSHLIRAIRSSVISQPYPSSCLAAVAQSSCI